MIPVGDVIMIFVLLTLLTYQKKKIVSQITIVNSNAECKGNSANKT